MIVEDHRMVSELLRETIDGVEGMRVAAIAGDGAEALAHCAEAHVDVVLMDIAMPTLDGVTATALMRSRFPDVRIVMLTQYEDAHNLAAAVRAGAHGYLSKQAGRDELKAAIRVAAAGGYYYEKALGDIAHAPMRSLSPRESDLLRLIAAGNSTKECADALSLTPETVRGYRKTLMGKMGAHNVAQLLLRGAAVGLLPRTPA
jgi:DNA-binding NarL/FixJ family response regulator